MFWIIRRKKKNHSFKVSRDAEFNRIGQVTKSAGRMPWHRSSMKDVTSCDKLRGVANTPRSADFRMGQPNISDDITMQSMGQTRGTETSHYPEEKKAKAIAQVVASERATAQTRQVTARLGL